MKHTVLSKLLLIIAMMALAACNGNTGASLDGSVKTILDIDFEETQIKLFNEALRIQYLKGFGTTTENDIVCEITVSSLNSELTTQTQIPFVGNATLDRLIYKQSTNGVLIEDSEQEFPPVFDGFISFDELSTTPGENISGNFSVTFNSGLVMSGEFSAPLELEETE